MAKPKYSKQEQDLLIDLAESLVLNYGSLAEDDTFPVVTISFIKFAERIRFMGALQRALPLRDGR